LGFQSSDILSLDDPRIWAGHFHLCDWNFEKGADGSLVYKDLNRDQTRYTDNLGNESDLNPPRPNVWRASFQHNPLYNVATVNYSTFFSLQISTGQLKKRRGSSSLNDINSSNNLDSKFKKVRPRGRPPKPLFQSYIGTADLVAEAFRDIHNHGRNCDGDFSCRRKNVTTDGLSLSMPWKCSKGDQCSQFPNGFYKYRSSSNYLINGKALKIANLRYSIAQVLTSVSKIQAEQFLNAMGLRPISRCKLIKVQKQMVLPFLFKKKKELQSKALFDLAKQDAVAVTFDACHSSSRHSQGGTSTLCSKKKLLCMHGDTLSYAYHKERLGLKHFIRKLNGHKVDVARWGIDHNRQSIAIIEAEVRSNAKNPEHQKLSQEAELDRWHINKEMINLGNSFIGSALPLLENMVKKHQKLGFDLISVVCPAILTLQLNKYEAFFSPINNMFSEMNWGTDMFLEVTSSSESIREFSSINGWCPSLETIPMHSEEFVKVYNLKKATSAPNIDSILQVKIKDTSGMKLLKALALVADPLSASVEERKDLELIIREFLPESCYIGDLYSADFDKVLQKVTEDFVGQRAELQSEKSAAEKNKIKVLSTCFGDKLINAKSLRELKTASIDQLFSFIIETEGVANDDKIDNKAKKTAYCLQRLWMLQPPEEDIAAACKIASQLFKKHLEELKHEISAQFRMVNDTWPGFSKKFKLNTVMHGILNWIDHRMGNHDQCARTRSHTICSEVGYIGECISQTSSNRGRYCNSLIPIFFRIFVTGFLLSRKMECLYDQGIHYLTTSLNESINHALTMFHPKNKNSTHGEYHEAVAAVYIQELSRALYKDRLILEEKFHWCKGPKELILNKAFQNPLREDHITSAIEEMLKDDPITMAECKYNYQVTENRIQKHNIKAQANKDAKNKGEDADVYRLFFKSEKITGSYNGLASNQQTASSFSYSARPVTAHPFLLQEIPGNEALTNKVHLLSKKMQLREKDRIKKKKNKINYMCEICQVQVEIDSIDDVCFACNKCDIRFCHVECLKNEDIYTCSDCSDSTA